MVQVIRPLSNHAGSQPGKEVPTGVCTQQSRPDSYPGQAALNHPTTHLYSHFEGLTQRSQKHVGIFKTSLLGIKVSVGSYLMAE